MELAQRVAEGDDRRLGMNTVLLPTYIGQGALQQGPGHTAQSLAERQMP